MSGWDTPTSSEAGGFAFNAWESSSSQSQAPSVALAEGGAEPPGGTLAFVPSATGTFVVAANPSTDTVHVALVEATSGDEHSLTLRTVGDVALEPGDEPGRVVADAAGRAHVALRRGGAIATLDPSTATLVDRTRACAAPRGLVYDRKKDVLHVACASGEIVTFDATTNRELKRQRVDRALEDVAMSGDTLIASTKTAILVVASDETVTAHEARGSIGALRTSPANAVNLVLTNEKTGFLTMTDRGMMGQPVVLDGAPVAVSDLDVTSDGNVALATNSDAFVLPAGASSFSAIGVPGITQAVGFCDVTTGAARRRVLVVQTDTPRGLVFFSLDSPPSVLATEPM